MIGTGFPNMLQVSWTSVLEFSKILVTIVIGDVPGVLYEISFCRASPPGRTVSQRSCAV
jgi:hypothetical protein